MRRRQRQKRAKLLSHPFPAEEPPAAETNLVTLSELFPSLGDGDTIDLNDAETQKLVRNLIAQELDLARTYIHMGRAEDARSELQEARAAAQRIGMLAEIGIIDDMLQHL